MIRQLAALFLTITLAFASVTAAVARGQPSGTAITICAGSGSQTILIGSDGRPVKPRVVCPDCTAALGPALAATPTSLPVPPVAVVPYLPAFVAVLPARTGPGLPGARAPPFRSDPPPLSDQPKGPIMFRILAALAALLAAPALAHDGPHIVDPYARVSGASATSGAVFFVIENQGEAEDRLLSVSTPVAARAELHTHVQDANGVMAMTRIDSVAIPAKGTHALERGGDHVMLLGLTRSLAQGDTIPLTLTFEQGAVVTIDVVVDNDHAPGPATMGHQHGAPSN